MQTGLRQIYERQRRGKHSAFRCSTTGQSSPVRPRRFESRKDLALTDIARAGDPTDTSIKLRPLEPASGQALARDLVLKTRRRKGLGDQIAVSKYLDDEFVVSCLSAL